MEVPTTKQLVDVYSQDSIPVQMKRWDNLLQQFQDKYGKKAEFVSRSPGRVNLIGEVRHLTPASTARLSVLQHAEKALMITQAY